MRAADREDFALARLGAILAGVPASPAYSLMSGDMGKIAHAAGLVTPAALYDDAAVGTYLVPR